MNPTYTIILTNDSYSDDIRYSEVFDRVPTRQDVIDSFGSISSGDHPSQTYTVIPSDGEKWVQSRVRNPSTMRRMISGLTKNTVGVV